MMINIAVALLAHQVILLVYISDILSDSEQRNEKYIVFVFRSLQYTFLFYFGTVLMFLFAAEAVNLFVRIVLIFSEIENYVIKATLTAWSKL